MIDVGFKGEGLHTNQRYFIGEMSEAELKQREVVIAEGQQKFIAVGTALLEIRDGKGYRFEHKTFEEYCEKRWGFSRQQGYRLMDAAALATDPIVTNLVTIENESQAREIKRIGIEALKQAAAEPVTVPLDDEWNEREEPKDQIEKVKPGVRVPATAKDLIKKAQQIKNALKPARADRPRVNWSQHAKSATNDEAQLIKWLLGLYNGGAAVDLDPTYSEGKLWDGLPKPMRKGDICPAVEGCEQMDARDLPYPAASLDSIFFDPPFVPKNVKRENGKLGIIEKRFSGYSSMLDLWQMYADSFKEFYRVLAPGGLLLVKNMDQIAGGKFYSAFDGVVTQARDAGFKLIYISVLYSENPPMMSPNMAEQQNPRHVHCYYFVFRKP